MLSFLCGTEVRLGYLYQEPNPFILIMILIVCRQRFLNIKGDQCIPTEVLTQSYKIDTRTQRITNHRIPACVTRLSHPPGITFWYFSHYHKKWSKIGTEIKFGGSVDPTTWSDQPWPSIETTTRMDISVRNYGACIAFSV